jgi:peptidoglycan/LPS O-acetylase OafA/YrhL
MMTSWLTATDNRRLSETAKFGYIPGLDGLRAIAVLIVMVAHLGFQNIVPGGFGVTIFFFISGFLITRLLLAESEKSGIGLKNFYARRFVRLYPALLFMLFGTVALYGLGGVGRPSALEFSAGILYFMNFYHIFAVIPSDGLFIMPWTHLWSLAVEEHFYLMFPAFMLFCQGRWKRAAWGLTALLFIIPLWRTYVMFGTDLPYSEYNYMMTDARFDSLAWGCLLSVLLHIKGNLKAFKPLLGVAPTIIAGAAILSSFVIRDETFRFTARYSVQGAALFVLVLNFYYLKALSFAVTIMEWRWLAWVGQISYALYLWHVPIFMFLHEAKDPTPISILITIILTFAISAVSFYFVEKPFVTLRKRFGAHIIKTEDKVKVLKRNSLSPKH